MDYPAASCGVSVKLKTRISRKALIFWLVKISAFRVKKTKQSFGELTQRD